MEGKQMLYKLGRKSQIFLRKNAPTLLTIAGAAGVVTTAISAAKAAPKATELLNTAKEEKGEELTKLETIQVAGPVYIPTVALGMSSILCIFGANMLNKRSQAAITSAYALLDSTYNEYKKKVEELYGEAADIRIREEIVKDKYEEEDFDLDDGKILFYDNFSQRYFESTIEDVQKAEYQVNRTLRMRDYVYVNEFYEFLGIDPIEEGYELGWSNGGNLAKYWQDWIDFTHETVTMEDGLECKIIVMQGEPYLDFYEYS